MPSRKIEVEILGDASSLERAFGRGKKSASGFERGLKKATIGAGVALAGLGLAAKAGLDEFMQAEKVGAQTDAALKSTGDAANVTRGHIEDLAGALLEKSGVDDEAIQSSENLLLTFMKIRNEVGAGNDIFDQATKATLDLSVAMGKDLSASSVLVGKALNDPVRGISALTRVGVQFDNLQKGMIKDLVDGADALRGLGYTSAQITAPQMEILSKAVKNHIQPMDALKMANVQLTDAQMEVFTHMTEGGHVIEAQKQILAELTKEFGGSADAAGKTFSGQLNIAKENAKNFSAELVAGATPALKAMTSGLAAATEFMTEHQTATKLIIGVLAGLSAAVLLVKAGMVAYEIATAAATAAQWLLNAALTANPIGLVIVGLVALGAALVVLWTKSETFRDIVKGTWAAIQTAVEDVVAFFTKKVVPGITGFVDDVRDIFNGIKTWLGAHWKDALIILFTGLPGALWVALHSKWGEDLFEPVKDVFREVRDWIGGIVDQIVQFFEDLPGRIAGTVKSLPGAAIDKAKGVAGSIADKLNPFGDASSSTFVAPAGGGDLSIDRSLWDELGLGRSMGLVMSSGYRPGAITKHGTPSDHGVYPSKAIDMAGSSFAMAAYFRRLIGDPGVKQAFYDPLGSIFGGALSGYREGGHSDHVHVATYDQGGKLMPGLTLAYNGTGRAETIIGPGGGGATVNNFHFPNLVAVGKRELVDLIKSELARDGRRNGGSALGGYS